MPHQAPNAISVRRISERTQDPNQSSISRARCASRRRVLTDKRLTTGARCLYMLLDDYAGMRAECWPHQRTCGEQMGYSTRQVKRWIAELTAAGWIKIRRTQSGNRYSLVWSVPEHNAADGNVPSEVPRTARAYSEPDQELKRGDSNRDTSEFLGPEFSVDDARNLLFWAAGG